LVNGADYHYKFVVTLPNGTVLEDRNTYDLNGNTYEESWTSYPLNSTSTLIIPPYKNPNPTEWNGYYDSSVSPYNLVTAYFAEGSYLSSASVSSFTRTNALSTLVLNVSGDYVVNAPVTVTYTPYTSGTAGASKTVERTVKADRTIDFTGDIDPNPDEYRITVSRTTGTSNAFYNFLNVSKLTLDSFSASSGSVYDSVSLSVTPNSTSSWFTNIPWAGTETVTIQRKPDTITGAYGSVLATGLNFWPTGTNLVTARTGLDNASDGLDVSGSYIYRINVTGGYFGTKIYTQETYSVFPNYWSTLGAPTVNAPATTGNIQLDFGSGRDIVVLLYNTEYIYYTMTYGIRCSIQKACN
jgi:hypothetical protein